MDVPPAGIDAAFTLVGYYADMIESGGARPTDDLTSAHPRDRDRRASPHRRRGHRLPLPHGRRGQRDDDEAARQLLVLGMATSRASGPSRSPISTRIPDWVEETLRYDTSSHMLARIAVSDVELHGVHDPRGWARAAARGLGQPRPSSVRRSRPLRPRARHQPDGELRHGSSLLPGRVAGSARVPRRARGAAEPDRWLRDRRSDERCGSTR